MSRNYIQLILLMVVFVAAFGLLATLDIGDPERDEPHPPLPEPKEGPNATITFQASSGSSGTLSSKQFPVGIIVLLAVFIGALVFLFTTGDSMVAFDMEDESGGEDEDLEAVARLAGTAAEQIEAEADLSNQVHQAWYEMTKQLAVSDPETITPDKFEEYAIRAGMDSDDVTELTSLFQAVRYGQFDPSDREEQAVEALRRIEESYSDGVDER